MRKIALALVLIPVLPVLTLTACKEKEERCRYQIEAEYFAEGRLEAAMTVTIPNNTDNALTCIPFALYPNAFMKDAEVPPVSDLFSAACYYEGESYGGIEIKEVEGAKEWSISEDRSVLQVTLAKPLYPDESIVLGIDYSLTLAKANHRLGVGEHCVNLSYFYPMLLGQTKSGFYEYQPSALGEPFVLDNADFSVSLSLPSGMGMACAGMPACKTENDRVIYSYEGVGVREAAFVLGELSYVSAEADGVTIDYYYFADEAPEATLRIACETIATYSELFAPYPYKRFALAETDLYLGGMEYSGFVTLSSLLTNQERAEVVAHEAAHQWWYALVASNQAECAWQDEGLAQYSAALFFEKNPGYGVKYRDLIADSEGAYRSYFSVKSQLSREVDTSMSRPLNSFSGDYEYRVLAYDKGVVLFDRLRSTMGDRKFFSALKSYCKRYAGKIATQYDFIGRFASQEALILSFTEGRCVI